MWKVLLSGKKKTPLPPVRSAFYLLELVHYNNSPTTALLHSSPWPYKPSTFFIYFIFLMLLSAPAPGFEIRKSLVCCIISLQWHLTDCWMKAAARLWREETATAGAGSQCTQSWCDVLFAATLYSLAWLTCSKNAALQLSLVHEAKIMAQCRVMNYAWTMHYGMPCPLPNIPCSSWHEEHTHRIFLKHMHSECISVEISKNMLACKYTHRVMF